tara:strand:+ start:655 stop:1935 length:1281 start_codon:yes stop_codon:yes gene_type:complete
MTLAHKILGQITVDSAVVATEPKPFVAVAYNSPTAAVSTDAITWTTSTLPATAGWTSVTFGGGTYAAVAGGNSPSTIAAYSTDAITWTASTLPASKSWRLVTYGGGTFAAVGYYSDIAAYSTDAITWTASGTLPAMVSGPPIGEWRSVAYGGGTFAAVAYYSTIAAYSTDAITWTASTLPATAGWQSVTHGDGKFVAVAYGNTTAAVSTDGITWTEGTMPSSYGWTSVAYGDGKFVAMEFSDPGAYSTDGITWTASSPVLDSGKWSSVAYNGSTFAVVAGDAKTQPGNDWSIGHSAYSTDGITWTKTTNMPSESRWTDLSGGDPNYQGTVYTAPQTIYTVPSSTEAIVSSIFISNTSTTTDTYNFAVVPSGETLSDIHYIRKNTDIVAKDFHNIDTKITMSAGDSLVALSGAADKLNINVFGVEKS